MANDKQVTELTQTVKLLMAQLEKAGIPIPKPEDPHARTKQMFAEIKNRKESSRNKYALAFQKITDEKVEKAITVMKKEGWVLSTRLATGVSTHINKKFSGMKITIDGETLSVHRDGRFIANQKIESTASVLKFISDGTYK